MPRKTFGRKLAELREAAGLSQYALARRSGLTKQAMSRLEKDERSPTWETVQLLALALDVSTEAFRDELAHIDILAINRSEADVLVPGLVARFGEGGRSLPLEPGETPPRLVARGFAGGGWLAAGTFRVSGGIGGPGTAAGGLAAGASGGGVTG